MRDEFQNGTKEILARRVAYRCSNGECRKPTSGPQTNPGKAISIGVAAHITAASSGGPRFAPELSSSDRISPHNGIWLCQNCAKLIDSDPIRYTRELLLQWKQDAEERAIDELHTSRSAKELSIATFALDSTVCAYREYRWDPSKPFWPAEADPVTVHFSRDKGIGRYGRFFQSDEEANEYAAELAARYNHHSFHEKSRHQIYCEPHSDPSNTLASHPIFYVSISNQRDEHIVVNKIIAVVEYVSRPLTSAKSEVLSPIHTYEVVVGNSPGSYSTPIVPNLKVAGEDAVGFHLAIKPGGHGFHRLVGISLECSSGHILTSPLILITM